MRCFISNKSIHLMYIVLEPNTFLEDLLHLLVRKLSLSAFERSLIIPAVRKLMLDMPVPGRLGQMGSDRPFESML